MPPDPQPGQAGSNSTASPNASRVEMRGIVKRFGEVRALNGVDFDLQPGEIHALLGENGAGKSTLMHVLSGLYQPDEGSILVDGKPMRFRSASDAVAAGIGMVHQHFTLVDNFTVAENLALAMPQHTPFVLPRRGLAQPALDLAEKLGWKLDPKALIWQLPVGVQQRIEIVKVLAQNPRILIFDEPTAVLAPVELDELFEVLDRLRQEGRSLVFISHKLQEVMRLCDRVTVLRQGQVSGRVPIRETSEEDLARRMVGDQASTIAAMPRTGREPGDSVLEVDDLWVKDERGVDAVRGLRFEVRAREILGVAGVDGNGQAELAEAILGLRPAERGTIRLHGDGISPSATSDEPATPANRRDEVGYIPQDRRRAGLVLPMSVRDNLILEMVHLPPARRGPLLRWNWLNREAAEMKLDHDIRADTLEQPAGTLSGGNQQKIVIARSLRKLPRLMVALNPTRGVDVGATAYVHDQLRAQRDRGAAILLISTELDEVLALADRVAVLYEGQFMGIVPPNTLRRDLGLMMGGARLADG